MIIVVRGGGDLASGVVLRLHRAGLRVVVCELPAPLAVRRLVSFAEAIHAGEWSVEGVSARRVETPQDTQAIVQILSSGGIPVILDPQAQAVHSLNARVVVDGRMIKRYVNRPDFPVDLLIGLGPGFVAGDNCDAVVETNRGHFMGRVIWSGPAQADTGIPEGVADYRHERVLRSPIDGVLRASKAIKDCVTAGEVIAEVFPLDSTHAGVPIVAPFQGVIRGLLSSGTYVSKGLKIGDVDPRGDPSYCSQVSDKALSIGGGVLEAILSRPNFRSRLWESES